MSVAQRWFVARADAQRQGTENLVSFYDANVVMDHRVVGAEIVEGREEALRLLARRWARDLLVRTPYGPTFLSRDGAVTVESLGVANGRTTQIAFQTRFGPAGATSEAMARSEVSWRAHDPGDDRMIAVHAMAADYVAAWSGPDEGAIDALYARDASIDDGLLGTGAAGPDIADLAAQPAERGGLTGMTLVDLPDFASIHRGAGLVDRVVTAEMPCWWAVWGLRSLQTSDPGGHLRDATVPYPSRVVCGAR